MRGSAATWKTQSMSVEGGSNSLAVADVGLDQLGARIQILAATGREDIDDAHLESAREQLIDEVGADEAGASGNQYGACRTHRCDVFDA